MQSLASTKQVTASTKLTLDVSLVDAVTWWMQDIFIWVVRDGCASRTTQIKISCDALSKPNLNGWRKPRAWHVPDGTYAAVTGAIRVSGGPSGRNPESLGPVLQTQKQ
jgi:hypothetical protein